MATTAEAMADAIGSELVEQLATKADVVATKDDLDGSNRELRTWAEGKFQLLYWMLGSNLAFVVAIALALLFGGR